MTQTDNELVEAPKEEKQKPKIKFGKLRERVKKGELDPREVLTWYKEQPEQFSTSLVTFLKNQVIARRKKKEEPKTEKSKDKNKNKDRRKRGGKKGKQPRRTGQADSSKGRSSSRSQKGAAQKNK